MKRAALAGALVAVVLGGGVAYAQPSPSDVPATMKFVEAQPMDMDRAAWREKRRDAVKSLGKSKDKRAVPVLMKIAEVETFDIVGENAIEALGLLGDPQAVPLLQKIVADTTRDQTQRDLAKKALAKLGAKAEGTPPPVTPTVTPPVTPPPTTPPPSTTPEPTPAIGLGSDGLAATTTAPPDLGNNLIGGGSAAAPDGVTLPAIEDDVIAASDRLQFAAGNANFSYDTVRKRVDFDGAVGGTYSHRVEKPTLAYGWDGSANIVSDYIDPSGGNSTHGAEIVLAGDGEVRGYAGKLYGVGKAAVLAQTDYASATTNNGMNNTHETLTDADLQIALGGGWGRVIDTGAAIRVRRLAAALQNNRALGKPIDPVLARKLQLTWWSLRGERTTYRVLLATIAMLREAGVLLSEPDAGTSYEILNVLRDTQLFVRPVGLDVQVAIGEGYLRRPAGDQSTKGRLEQALAQASYGQELDDDKLQVTGTAFARLRLFPSDGTPAPWAIGATAGIQRFTYGEHGDALGALDAAVTLALSDDDTMASKPALSLSGTLGYTYLINQAGGLRLAAAATVDNGQLFLGAQFAVTYGLLDGTVSR